MIKKNKGLIVFIFFIFFLNFLNSESLPKNVRIIVTESFSNDDPYEVCKTLEQKIGKLNSAYEKKLAFSILADYEERCEFFSLAYKHYTEVANLATTDKKEFLIKAMGAALLDGKIDLAHSVCTKYLLPLTHKPTTKDDTEILIFFEWIKLKLIDDDSYNYSLEEVRNNLKNYVTNSLFAELHPAILLTLWWMDDDKKAENTLLKKFPNSVETSIVKGRNILSPTTFWYLIPGDKKIQVVDSDTKITQFEENKPSSNTKDNDKKEPSKKQETKPNAPQTYQVGVFKNKDYAVRLGQELAKKKFTVALRTKKTKTQTVYSVLVKVDNKGDIVLRLKNEGYEAVPIFE